MTTTVSGRATRPAAVPFHCAACGATAREVSLWTDIVALYEQGQVVCCTRPEVR